VTQEPYVVVVILNMNRRQDTLACLASLQQSAYRNHGLILLDVASGDGSVEAVQKAFPGVEIIRLAENKGYA
jgi:GT2 family glycosyltransferase